MSITHQLTRSYSCTYKSIKRFSTFNVYTSNANSIPLLSNSNTISALLIVKNKRYYSSVKYRIPTLDELRVLDIDALFKTVRLIKDIPLRRNITKIVYSSKLEIYRMDKNYKLSNAANIIENIHDSFRQGMNQVVVSSSKLNININDFNMVNSYIQKHHVLEDNIWFPKLRKKIPSIEIELNYLEKDHKYLNTLEKKILNGEYDALVEFNDALNYHLDKEEILTIPFILDGTADEL